MNGGSCFGRIQKECTEHSPASAAAPGKPISLKASGMPEAVKATGSRSEHGARGRMDFHKSRSKRDRQGAREVVELGLCCSQKGGCGREENQGEAYREVQGTPDERATGLIRRSLEMFSHYQ